MSRRVTELAAALACLALATVLLLTTPLRDRAHERIVDGRTGAAVSGEELRLEVHAVRVASSALVNGRELASPGVFVVLDVTAEALGSRPVSPPGWSPATGSTSRARGSPAHRSSAR